MKYTRGKYRILIHLANQDSIEDSTVVPYRVCQSGIAESVDLSRSRTSKLIKQLIEEDLVKEETSRVVGLKRRRKVYSLTRKGLDRAKEVRGELEKKKVILKTESSKQEIKLDEIYSYIESQSPLIVGLNNIDENGVIDLSKRHSEPKDVFANREKETEFLSDKLEQVSSEGTLIVLIRGYPGLGKTRLVNHFKKHVLSEGFEFLSGRGHYSSSEPYLPFYETLREHFEKKEDLDQFGLSFLPSKESSPAENTPMSFSQESEPRKKDISNPFSSNSREIIFTKVSELFREISRDSPFVFFLDDLQWVDKTSLMLFHYLAKNLNDAPILIIGAYRPNDLDRDDFFDEMIHRLKKEDLIEELELDQLEWEDTKEIVEGLLGGIDTPDDFIQIIHTISEGNPLLNEELTKQMMEDGTLDPKKNEFPTNEKEIEVPNAVENIIERRTDGLSTETYKVLQVSSIIGEQVDFTVLRKVMGMDSIDLLEHIDMLTGAGLLESGPGEDAFDFTHGLIHSTIYENVPTPLKKELHKEVAEAMRDVFEENIEEYYSNIGRHYEEAGEYKESLEFYLKQGKRNRTVCAHESAIDLYEKSLELAEKVDQEETKWEIFENLGDVYLTLGEFDTSIEYYEKIPNKNLEPKEQQRLSRKVARVYEKKGELNQSLEYIGDSLKQQFEEYSLYFPLNVETCRLLYRKGWVEMKLGDYNSAKRDLSKALEIGEVYGSEQELSSIYHALGTISSKRGKYDEAYEDLERALEMREKLDDVRGKASSLSNIGTVYLEKGDLDKALKKFQDSLEILKEIGDKSEIPSILVNIGNTYLRKGEMEKAYEYFRESYNMFEESGNKRGMNISLNNLGSYYMRKGEFDAALEHYEKSIKLSEENDIKEGLALGHNNFGEVYNHKEKCEEAESHYQKSIRLYEEMENESEMVEPLSGLAEVLTKKEDHEEALNKAKRALNISERIGSKLKKGIGHKILGIVYRNKDETEKARDEFEKAEKLLEEKGAKEELSEVFYQYALLSDEEKEMEKYLNKAQTLFQDAGMEIWSEKCEKKLNKEHS